MTPSETHNPEYEEGDEKSKCIMSDKKVKLYR